MIRREVTRRGASSIETYYYKNTAAAIAHTKNDLPCRILENEFDKDYINIMWINKESDEYYSRNNDLPSYIEYILDNSDMYYTMEYGMYNMFYRYNGYAYYLQNKEKHYNFINGISIEYISVCINEDDEDYDND